MDRFNSSENVQINKCEKHNSGKKRFAIMIGLDGARPEALQKAKTPTIDSMIQEGMYSWKAKT